MAISDQDKQTLSNQVSSCGALSGSTKSRMLSHIAKQDSSMGSFQNLVNQYYGYDKFSANCQSIGNLQQRVTEVSDYANTIGANTGIAKPNEHTNFVSSGYKCAENSNHIAFRCVLDGNGNYVVTDNIIFDNRACTMASAFDSSLKCAAWAALDENLSLTFNQNQPCSDFLGLSAGVVCNAGL